MFPFRITLWLILLAVAGPSQPPQSHPSLVRLCQASSLDDSLVGESAAVSPNYQAYLEASLAQLSTPELAWLRDHGTPAGRIYGALLLTHLGRVSVEAAFANLPQDRAELRFASGCEVLRTTVAEVSQAMIREGNYLGFTGQLQWLPWKSGRLAAVSLENQLYSSPAGEFYVHVGITNLAQQPIGVELGRPYRLIYPNQWTGCQQRQRQVIDERRIPHKPLEPAEAARLVADFRAKKLTFIEPAQMVSYYVPFNGPAGRSAVDQLRDRFLIIAMDGQLWLSDGTASEAIARLDSELSSTDVAFALPIRWKPLPARARLAPQR